MLAGVLGCISASAHAQEPREKPAQGEAAKGAATRDAAAQDAAAEGETTETPSLEWNPRHTRVGAAELALTGVVLAGAATSHFLLDTPDEPLWQGSVLIDGQARGLLRHGSEGGRSVANAASDALLHTLMIYPFVDAGLVAWGYHGSADVAAQMFAINGQAFALSYLITDLTKKLFRRERPFGQLCDGSANQDSACDNEGRYKSFVSGHTSMAFTGAGLICAHHLNMPLYGGGAADVATCATAMTAASAVGMLRIASDKHYMSDVFMGAAVGLFSGYLVPKLFHYTLGDVGESQSSDASDDEGPSGSLSPMVSGRGLGLSYQGVF